MPVYCMWDNFLDDKIFQNLKITSIYIYTNANNDSDNSNNNICSG